MKRLAVSTAHNTVVVEVGDDVTPWTFLNWTLVHEYSETGPRFIELTDAESGAACLIAIEAIAIIEEEVPPPKPLDRQP